MPGQRRTADSQDPAQSAACPEHGAAPVQRNHLGKHGLPGRTSQPPGTARGDQRQHQDGIGDLARRVWPQKNR